MKIGIIGSGMIGTTVGTLWLKAGHEVFFSSRHPETVATLAQVLGPKALSGSVEEAIAFGEVLFFAVPFGMWPELAQKFLPVLQHKVVIDAGNPYPDRDGVFAEEAIAAGEGSGLFLKKYLPEVALVKTFNTLYFRTLQTESNRPEERLGMALAGDHSEAVTTVSQLVSDAGFDPVVVGGLARVKDFDPGMPVYNQPMNATALRQALNLLQPV